MTTDSPKGPENPPARERVAEYYRTLWGYASHNDRTWQAADRALEALRPEIEQVLFERDAAQATADNITQQLEDLRDDVLGDESLHVLEVASAAGRKVERLTAEVERLREQVEQQHEINAGWVAYGERMKVQRRRYSEELAAAIGYDQQRWVPIEGMIPLVEQRTKSLADEVERLGKAVASWQDLWQSKEEWEQAATDSWTRQDALSGLLRGMARRVGELRQSLKFADAHVPQWERIIGDHKAEIDLLREQLAARPTEAQWKDAQSEIKRLEENESFLESAVHVASKCCDGTYSGQDHCLGLAVPRLYGRVRAALRGVSSSEVEAPTLTNDSFISSQDEDEPERVPTLEQLRTQRRRYTRVEGRPSGSERLAPRPVVQYAPQQCDWWYDDRQCPDYAERNGELCKLHRAERERYDAETVRICAAKEQDAAQAARSAATPEDLAAHAGVMADQYRQLADFIETHAPSPSLRKEGEDR